MSPLDIFPKRPRSRVAKMEPLRLRRMGGYTPTPEYGSPLPPTKCLLARMLSRKIEKGWATPIHWNYFLGIESDLLDISKHIELNEDNYANLSINLARLLISASSEVDVVAKLICSRIDIISRPKNIFDYRNTLVSGFTALGFPEIFKIETHAPRFHLTFTPWEAWERDKESPEWWSAYNNVKHQRGRYFKSANLGNTLNAVSGLFVLLLVYYKLLTSDRIYPMSPQLFAPPRLFQDGRILYGLTHG